MDGGVRLVTLEAGDQERLDAFVTASPYGHYKQLWDWGEILKYEGSETIRLGVERDGALCAALTIYVRPVPRTGWTILTGLRGPVMALKDREALACLLAGVRDAARRHRAVCFRLDPDIAEEDGESRQILLDAGFVHLASKKWSLLNEPRIVMVVDLAAPEADLLRRMRESHRQNIRGFDKKGCTLRDARDTQDLKAFYELWREIGTRRGFPVRGFGYYEQIWTRLVGRGLGRVRLAEHEGTLIAALLALQVGRKSWIVHGALADSARKLKPNEAVWWDAMRWAKQQGALFCDFGSSGTDWPPREDAPGYSVYNFKCGFRADTVVLTGYYDLVLKPLVYRAFRFAEERVLPRVDVSRFSR